MKVYEYSTYYGEDLFSVLTDDYSDAKSEALDDESIIVWEAELAPDFGIFNPKNYEAEREFMVKNGYNYCNGVGWVKLLNRLN